MPSTQFAWRFNTVCLAVLAAFMAPVHALPPNFEDVTIGSNWNQAVGLCFAPDGRMFVWEKAGRVWNVENGVKAAQPLIDIREEVGNWADYGLLGFAIDPNFYSNGHIYLMYVVDYHHLIFHGTPGYNPQANTYNHDTIARITRYTCNAADGYRSVDMNSRFVLVGEAIHAGIPICHMSHGIGTLVFGEDGTLLASCGDAASYETVDVGGPTSGSSYTALGDGIIQAKEDVGSYRAQLVDSLDGKVLRLDPSTGDGVPSNPFYDALAPRAPRSRVWAMGLRNPYRMSLRPGTGNADPTVADPGTLYIGDVGWVTWEELNICRGPGVNFGWPVFEGLEENTWYSDASPFNFDAQNPLYNIPICNEPFFRFRDLILQETLESDPLFPNPCDPGEEVPGSLHRFVHRRPALDWLHSTTGPARTGGFVGNSPVIHNVGASGSPVAGPQFGGSCALAGVWYSGTNFPPEYQDTLFFADFSNQWIRSLRVDANENPVQIRDFARTEAGAVVAMGIDPTTGSLYYINYNAGSSIHRVTLVDNLPPLAVASADPYYGPWPLTVQFSSAGSSDPESQALTYLWEFGDGTPVSTEANPTHVFGYEDITGQGTIISRIGTLDPPHPLGGGNWDPEVIRDGDMPPAGSGDSSRQFDTYHEGDQGALDYVGYEFPTAREFRSLIFQEGIHFWDGGWFESIHVHYFDGGAWQPVPGLSFSPVYGGNNGVNFETYLISFTPVTGTRIRLSGNPGGSASFISIGELRVIATPASPIATPQGYTVSLTVRDTLNSTSSTSLVVSANNTPPVVEITSPSPGATFSSNEPTPMPLTATIVDAEHGPGEYTCRWQTILHHDDHVHPEPFDAQCDTETTFFPHGDAGDVFYYEVQLLVTDDAGLSTMQSVNVMPDCDPLHGDFDADSEVDGDDVTAFRNCFAASGPVAPGCEAGDTEPDGDIDCDDWLLIHASYECMSGHDPAISITEFAAVLIDANIEPGLRCIADIDGDGALTGLDVAAYVEHVLAH